MTIPAHLLETKAATLASHCGLLIDQAVQCTHDEAVGVLPARDPLCLNLIPQQQHIAAQLEYEVTTSGVSSMYRWMRECLTMAMAYLGKLLGVQCRSH